MFKKSSACLVMVILIMGLFAATAVADTGTPFSYEVGQTFIVDGKIFKMVDKNMRYAVATDVVMTTDWGKADTYARGFAQSYSYILASGLPGYADYSDPAFRSNVGNLTSSWEWTSTPYPSAGAFWIGHSSGAGGDNSANSSRGVRPALYLKSGLFKSLNGCLYEPLPSTFGDLIIQ